MKRASRGFELNVSRLAIAKASMCGACRVNRAKNLCGCWRNELGEECRAPLCRACADIRMDVWRCKRCARK